MMNNNKILTVSYGTFSCTLEGFDDSFETMKAIAEYFRDLAADDRYFGAEPPQPDAEMLARIAEREVSRRVEAREHEGQILLKAHDDAVLEEAEQAPASSPAVATAAPVVQEDTQSAPIEEPEAAPEASEPAADVVTEDLDETLDTVEQETSEDIEAVVEETPVEDVVASVAEPVEDADAEREAEPIQEVEQADAVAEVEEDEAFETEEPVVAEQDEQSSEVEAFFADSPSLEDIEPDVDAELEGPTEFSAFETPAPVIETESAQTAASDSIAAKLQRIRDVVSQQDDEDYDEEEVSAEGEAAIDMHDLPLDMVNDAEKEPVEEQQSELTAAAQEIEEAFEVDDQIAAEADAETEEDDDLAAVLSRLEDEMADQDDEPLAATEDDLASDDIDENLFDEIADDTENEVASEPAEADLSEVEEEQAPVKGRVLKVDRADLEAALEAGDLEEFETDASAALSAADEEDLQRELDAVAAEASSTEAQPTAEGHGLPPIDANAAEDVSRLMAEADQQMEEPEGATRRSAFAHLRAAVAARFADKTMQKEEPEEETTKPYRSDLAQVVKPRRPVPSGARTERPAEARPTPLKLVAEQRIDGEAPASGDPIMPRRVAATLEDDLEFAQDTGFAEFAEQVGATKLPEVLEAAAAYLSFVEGHEQFSRPQLMTRVRQADCGEFSREDGLRSFGQLLRAGKIEKIKGGRFTASDEIGFKPDERAAS